jgi:hypothetical protein
MLAQPIDLQKAAALNRVRTQATEQGANYIWLHTNQSTWGEPLSMLL